MAEKRHSNGVPSDEGTIPGPQPAAPEVAAAEADVPAVWSVGDVILDLYEVKQIYEGGGMGLVYRVRHRTWSVDMAVKSPRPEYFQSEAQKENFQREAETWVNLDLHPHIVSCHYVRRLGGIPRIFAEYVEGGSLSQWIREGKLYEGGPQQALQRILDIAIQMAWGLHFAHQQGLVHQDVKPANVMMTPDGIAKVTDFGLARARATAGEAGTAPGGGSILVSWGGRTPAYASPEQEAGKKLSPKTDIWSWAVSVLEMFTGGVTWGAGPAAGEALEEYLARGPEPDQPTMPESLVALLRRCFAWEPQERPGDMAEVVAALQVAYSEALGEPYPREEPEAVELRADGLNNRALSMLDLGKLEEAERLWEEALKADPQHLHATYNRGLHLWRSARMADDGAVRQLEALRATRERDCESDYLLGLVHLERGDVESAVSVLREAAETAPKDETVAAALKVACQQKETARCLRTLEGNWVTSVALTADGQFALSGSWDKTLRLWELSTGRCLRTLESHTDRVESVALTSDGRFALSGSCDKTLRLWELATGRCLRTLKGHTGAVTAVALTGDARFALSGSWDKTLRLWELATGRCLLTLVGHADSVTSVALTSDAGFALSASQDKTLRLWELASGRCLGTFEGHTDIIRSMALAADGRFALSGSDDSTLRLWELASGRCLRTLEGHSGLVLWVSMKADGRFALSASDDKTLRLWEVASGRCLRTLAGHSGDAGVALTPDGRFAFSGGLDGILRLWEVGPPPEFRSPWSYARLRPATTLADEARAVEHALARAGHLASEGEFRAAATEVRAARSLPGYERRSDLVEAWRQVGRRGWRATLLGAWHLCTLDGHTDSVASVALTADGRLALSGGLDGTLRLWDLTTGRCLRTLTHSALVMSVALTVDGRFALSVSDEQTPRLWELSTGRCLRTFKGHTEAVTAVALTPGGRFALSASQDKTLRLWELASGRCLGTFEGHTDIIRSVALTSDGRFALSGGWDRTLRLWELSTGRCLRTLAAHEFFVTSVALTSDGRFALSGSRDKTLRLWELASGRCLRALKGHTEWVNSVALTPDGRFALSGSGDSTLRLWELSTGRCLRTLEGPAREVSSVAVTADGRFALSGSWDKTLRLWELDWDYEFPDAADWDKRARPYLETFLTLHTPYAAGLPEGREPSEEEIVLALTRRGNPSWTEEDFQGLIRQLQHAGYGWLRPDGVRVELECMARDWEGPPPLFGAGESISAGGSFLSRLFRRGT
jgi:WD40 repeat protein